MIQLFIVAALAAAPAPAHAAGHVQTVEVKVTDNGYEPSQIKVAAGTDVQLKITRTSDLTCAKGIQFPSKHIKEDLPLNKTVTIDLGELKKGELKFGCLMNMMETGVVIAE